MGTTEAERMGDLYQAANDARSQNSSESQPEKTSGPQAKHSTHAAGEVEGGGGPPTTHHFPLI